MSTTQTTLTSVELVERGQPSPATLATFKTIGTDLTDEQITAAWDAVEKARVSFGAAAILCGCVLLAKKQALKHGQWKGWCEKFGGKLAARYSGKLAAPLPICEEVTPRSIRVYCTLAQHFIADLEQKAFSGEIADHRPAGPDVSPADILAVAALDDSRRGVVVSRIEQFVAGRSLRRMLSDLRRAEHAADLEQAQDAKANAGTGAASGSTSDQDDDLPPPPVPLQGEQLQLWHDVARPLHELDTFIQDRGSLFKRTDRAFWLAVQSALETRLTQAKAALKEIA
jgi:hypothetical protein